MSTELVMPSNHLVLCCTLLLLLSIIPSIRVYSSESALCIGWSQYCTFSFRISLSNEYSYMISFRIDWFYLLAVRDSQESSLATQFEGINSSLAQPIYFSSITSVYDYRKNHSFDYMDLCWQSNVSAFCLDFLSRLVIAFLPRSKSLLISWLQSPSAVILKPRRIKSVTVSIISPSICQEVMELICMQVRKQQLELDTEQQTGSK